jgi:hypothetical protein
MKESLDVAPREVAAERSFGTLTPVPIYPFRIRLARSSRRRSTVLNRSRALSQLFSLTVFLRESKIPPTSSFGHGDVGPGHRAWTPSNDKSLTSDDKHFGRFKALVPVLRSCMSLSSRAWLHLIPESA